MENASLISWQGRMRVRIGPAELLQFAPDEDTRCLFDLRNHPSVRTFMPSSAPLQYEAHRAWVGQHLATNPDFLMFIVRRLGTPVGFTLLKRLSPGVLEVGLMFVEQAQNQRLVVQAAVVTAGLAIDRFGARRLVSFVNPSHHHARTLNEGLGMGAAPSQKPGELCYASTAEALKVHPVHRRVGRSLEVAVDFI